MWIFIPGLRRNTRVDEGNRCDCLKGSVFNLDDGLYFAGGLLAFTWKFVKVKEHLISALQSIEDGS
jgi:hypothetical protein